jgi:hypothetical protein
VDLNNGFGDLVEKVKKLPAEKRAEIEADIKTEFENRPGVAMVNSDEGITNLHVPSDIIVDASMPAMIRASGKMYDAKGGMQDTLAVIPDRCYSGVYQTTVSFARSTARSIQLPWDLCLMSGSWPKQRRSTVRTIRRSKLQVMELFVSSMLLEMSFWSIT